MATIQERLDRMRMDSIQQRLDRMKQDSEKKELPQGGFSVTLPTAQQGTVTLPRADQDGGGGGNVSSVPSVPAMPTQGQAPPFVPASAASRAPSLGARNIEVVQEEMDGMDSAIQKLKKRQESLKTQARQVNGRSGAEAGGYLAGLNGQAQELERQIAQMERNRAGLQEEWNQADQRQFEQLRQTAGFRAAVDKAMSAPFGKSVDSLNPAYADVRNAMAYFQAKEQKGAGEARARLMFANMALDRMDEGQRERLAYYVGMGDYDSAADYLNRIVPKLNQEQATELEQGLTSWGQEHPVMGAAVNVMSWPLNVPAYFDNARQAAENLVTGQDKQSNNMSAVTMPKVGTGTSQGVQEAARSAAAQAFGSETAGEVAAFLAGTGLSIGQNAAQIALLGPYSLAGMSISAAGSATADALDRGATPQQAFIVGTSSGAIEAVTEKIPLDNLFRLAKEGGGKGLKAAVVELLKQMGTEASEEMISEIANNLVDTAVMGDSSEFQMYVKELQEAGLSKEEAERQAFQQFYLINVGMAGLGGAISGGVMSGGALTFRRAGELTQRLNAGKQGAEQTNAAIDRAYQAMVEKGMFSQEAGQAVGRAQEEIGKGAALLSTGERPLDVRSGSVIEGQQPVGPSVQTPQAAGQAGEANTREIVPDSDTAAMEAKDATAGAQGPSRVEQIENTKRLLRESFHNGEISEEQFDAAMDLIMEQEGLAGLDMLDTRRFGGMTSPTTTAEGGAEHGTGNFETAAPAGQQLSDGIEGRISDQGTAGQDGVLAESGSRRAADTGRTAVERQAVGRDLQLEAISSRELGVTYGTDARTVRMLPETAWDSALRETARKVRRETGMGVRFVLGGIQVTGNDGGVHRVRGVYGQGGIIVQADNLRVAPEQIADHEIFHSYAQQDPGLVQAVEDAIVERYGQEEMDRIVDAYIKNLRGIVDVPESGADLDFEQAYADIKNEVFADAFAGINAFGAHAEQYQGAVLDTLEERGAAGPQGQENAQATERRTGPPDTYSIDYDQNNRPFVTVEEDILAGVPREDWVKTVKDNLCKKFPNGVTVGNNEIKIDKQSRGEMTYSRYTRHLLENQPKLYEDKLRATNNADELLLASRDWVNEEPLHPRKDDIVDFARGEVQLRVGGSDYAAQVIVGKRKNGSLLLYDVINLTPADIQVKKQKSGAAITENPSPGADRSTASGFDSSISQAGKAVKGDGLFFPTAEQGTVTLPTGEESMGTQRYSADEDQDAPASDSGTSVVDTLPTKAREYLQKAERRLTNKVGELLSVPKSARREFLQDIVRSISTEYLSTGQVSQETRDQLFEQAYQQGVQADREYYDTYKHVRDYLRSTPITVSEWLKGDIDDYDAWRKSAFGTLRLVKKGGNGPDTAYMELQHMAPELFPDSIIHPADQLRHILETAQGIRVSEQSLKEAYGPEAEEFKRWSRRDFDEAVADALGDLKQVKRYADERTQQAEARQAAQAPMTVQEVAELWKQKKDARHVYEKAMGRNLLTQHDEMQVGRLLRGELELEHLDPAKDNVKGITEVYQAAREYEDLAGRIRQWNQQRKADLREQADGFLEGANQWKDKKAGLLYSRETMERNIRDIVPDQELADRINRAYFQPVHEGAAKANRAKNEYRDRVRDLKLSRKAAKGDAVSEAHAVQLLGEAEDNIQMLERSQGRMKERDGKTLEDWRGVVQNLWETSPGLDQEKIRGAVQEFRAIYDELF